MLASGRKHRNTDKQRENGRKKEPPRGTKGVGLLWKRLIKTARIDFAENENEPKTGNTRNY
jgi:hypothetical protein